TQLGAALDARCDGRAPPTSQIRRALEACQDVIKDVARAKLAAASVPAETATTNGAPGPASGSAAGPREATNGLSTRDEPFRHLLQGAAYFQRPEPHSIVPYALEQVVRWGRASLPDLLTELIPEDAPRQVLFKQVGIKAPAAPNGKN